MYLYLQEDIIDTNKLLRFNNTVTVTYAHYEGQVSVEGVVQLDMGKVVDEQTKRRSLGLTLGRPLLLSNSL